MNSSRLPGKAMLSLAGKPLIAHMIERHRKSKYTDEVILVTSTDPSDDVLVEECKKANCLFYRGSLDDVLGRIATAAQEHNADIIVQGMADSPLVDWRIIDEILLQFSDGYDLVVNDIEGSLPIGLDARAFTLQALLKAENNVSSKELREHASLYLYKNPDLFKIFSVKNFQEINQPNLRITLDTLEDYIVISHIYNNLYYINPDFTSKDVIEFLLKNPNIASFNIKNN